MVVYDAITYLEIAGGLSVLVCCIVYCAKNWDDPPDWWPNCLKNEWQKDSLKNTEYENL